MPVYIGSLGRMVKLPYVGSQQVQTEERYNFSSTLEGKRKAQVKPKGPRTWALSADHFRPNEHSLLSQFANGAWGPGPFVFLPADAPVSNVLTPDAGDCKPGEYVLTSGMSVTGTPPMLTPDGWAASSFLKTTTNGLYLGVDLVPLLAGQPVTVAAYVRGSGGAVGVWFYDSAGGFISSQNSSVTAGSTNVVRSWLTVTPPVGAVSLRASVTSQVSQVAWPTVTWTDKLMPHGDGQGCPKAVVTGYSRDQVLSVAGHTYSNVSFTVQEVG